MLKLNQKETPPPTCTAAASSVSVQKEDMAGDATVSETLDILHSLLDRLQSGNDAAALRSLMQTMQQTAAARQRVVSEVTDAVQAAVRQTEQAKTQTSASEHQLAQTNHTETLLTLDRTKFAMARLASDLTDTLATAERELKLLQEEAAEVDAQDTQMDESDLCVEKVQARIYSQLGLKLIKNDCGDYSHFITTSKRKNDMQTFEISDEYSQFYYANMIWELI
ncbi:hypothetical protein BASA50_008723 [Batrachochytrium salamandrivorans]|uniref:Kinetochore protein Spc24 n=1 Tax=Batrachochytrium salamandrivorans TaxID=1357716 RepID=A0ABQ8F6F1_9FUNG|nr:hypothetical protein BASA62_008273 [Batrachochytrium salamandrivorans]KAH6571450.1 hypothetical protein BASA60_007162 [Batrachochytrium salamandrivorans]KAH6589246.1 hypothetical protein BASA61_005685 [Batrachochytrium salamandrivorans]KAH6591369.1 hypothetical protein BASA50_008723 [Batrachochytrium salamandrivorans]KAH9252584.1 hypothetical protein BASA81_009453 [Batrachochytrium salamandrivorans]